MHDLIDRARPGEEIEVTGIYRHGQDSSLNARHGFPVFSTLIEANYVQKREDKFSQYHLTEEDKAAILRLASDPAVVRRITSSIAPSIYGHDTVKVLLALNFAGALFAKSSSPT